MPSTEKIHSSNDSTYDRLLMGVPQNVLAAIAACRMSSFQVFIRYIDHADPEESYHDWLITEYPENKPNQGHAEQKEIEIPQYTNAEELRTMFETLPRVDGLVTDEYLQTIGLIAVKAETL